MDLTQSIALGVLVLFVLVAARKLLAAPLKTLLKALFNTLLGFLALLLINRTAGFTGLQLGFNPLNAGVIGLLGLPGLILLLLLQWVLP